MGFSYEYKFEFEYQEISVVINHDFAGITDVEDISQFPHGQRRSLGRHILENYDSDTFYTGALLTLRNPFVRQLGKLFGERFWFYWTRRHTDTLIFITGLALILIYYKLYRLFLKWLWPDHCESCQRHNFRINAGPGIWHYPGTSVKSYFLEETDFADGCAIQAFVGQNQQKNHL